MDIKTKYYVVSLPRSGTTSICKMAKMCGLNSNHAPVGNLKYRSIATSFDFFSDTPVFCPREIENICSYDNVFPKFIYIDRCFSEIFDSWKRVNLYKNYKEMLSTDKHTMNHSKKFDFEAYQNAFNEVELNDENYIEIFQKHKNLITEEINKFNKPLLIYNFNEGWEPFCDFLNVSIPEENIPILNKNKMFDAL